MKKIFSIFVATLLLSTTLWAQNVAKVTQTADGTLVGEYPTMAEALAAWKDGTTLTMLDNATYTATATYTVAGTQTLDLADKTLTWDFTSSDASPIAIKVAGDGAIKNGNIKATMKGGNFPSFMVVSESTAKLQLDGIKIGIDIEAGKYGKVVRSDGGGIALSAITIDMQGCIQAAIYTQAGGHITQCENVTIVAENVAGTASCVYGMYAATKTEINMNNITIDLSNVDEKKPTEAIRFIRPGSIPEEYFVFSSGTLTCNSNASSISANIYQSFITLKIEGGKFSTKPAKGSGTLTISEGKVFAKVGEYYELVGEGLVGLIGSTPYTTFEELWAACPDGVQTSVTLLNEGNTDAITIPANKNILLNIGVPAQEYNITNNGIVTLNSTMKGSFANSTTGKLSVMGGTFAAKEYNAFVKDNIANGYMAYQTNASAEAYKVFKKGSIAAAVNYVMYEYLQDALQQSSAKYPAQLICDYEAKGKRNEKSFQLSAGVDAHLNLDGHTLTLPKQYGVDLENAHLTISNGTLNCTQSSAIDLIGSAETTAKDYTTLTINSDVTVKQSEGQEYFVSISEDNISKPYGVVVNFHGKYEGQCPFYVHGSLTTISDNAPTFNIGATAKITANSLAYAAGYGIWNYEGTATTSHHGFELRAGKLTMNGGSIICTATAPADDQFNGNGSTSQACAIAVCQHSTQLPVSVVIDGGSLKAYTPIYQANPQNNPQEAIDKVSVEVNNAQVFSTSKNIVWSANKKVVLNGGVYNLSPAAYVAEGKAVVENTNADTKEMYPYAIGKKDDAVATAKAGNWNEAATWAGGAVPTAATPVIIQHAVVIPANVKAEVMGMDVQSGVITVEGTLAVGNEGIKGITNASQLLIKDGGAMVISPAATSNNRPLATVELKTVIRDVKDEYTAGDRSYEYIWQNIGLPVTSMTIAPAKTLTVNTWDIMSAWVPATEFGTAFRGYHITNMNNKPAGMLYTFAGQLVGNQNATLSMPRDGFHFFGNSWMAPFDVKEILNQLNSKSANGVVTPVVYVYVSDKLIIGNKTYNDGQYMDITLAQLDNADYAAALGQIAAMQGFFLHSDGQATISLNYEKAVWNATLAKPAKASKYAEEEATAVRISLTAENGRSDEVYLYEGEAFAAPKMMNVKPNVNIYAITANGNYSTMGLDKVEGTQLGIQTNAKTNYIISFDWLKGETLYLKDKKENKYIAMTESATYSFTAEANTTIDNRFEIVGKSNVPTMIENTESNVAATGIYSITGQYIGEPTMWNTLPAGLYIVNGQKRVK